MVMFLVMGLVIIVAMSVIVGLFYFINSENEKKTSSQAIPIVDVSELKELASQPLKNNDRSAFLTQTDFSNHEDELLAAKSKLSRLEKDIVQKKETADSFGGLQENLVKSSESGIVQDNSFNKIAELEARLAMITQKAVEQAEDAVKVIERLMQENEQLKMNQSVMTTGGVNAQDAAAFIEMKERTIVLENQLDLSVAKSSQLELQLTMTKKELGQQLLEANATIARLKMESEAQEKIAQDALLRSSQEIEELRKNKLQQSRDIEEGFIKSKEENLLLKDAKKLLEAKISVMEDDFKNELNQVKQVMSDIVAQKEEATQQVSLLEKDVSKYKDLNTTLIDKAKILQYELNRYRAQASGLEKVCENFKSQMEEMFEQIEQAKKDNNKLLQERINLEAGFVSLKTENSRLMERDKTYQQELEKTKEQINRFEKIYQNFQSNVGGVSEGNKSAH